MIKQSKFLGHVMRTQVTAMTGKFKGEKEERKAKEKKNNSMD